MHLCLVLAFDFLPVIGLFSCPIGPVYPQATRLRFDNSSDLGLFHHTSLTIFLTPCRPFPSFFSGLPPNRKSPFAYLELPGSFV